MQHHKYSGYRAVDFLQDEDFLRWQICQSEEDASYWRALASEDSVLRAVLAEAVDLYKESVRFNDYRLSPSEIDAGLHSLHAAIEKRSLAKSRRSFVRWTIAAACLLAIAIVTPLLLRHSSNDADISRFAQQLPAADFTAQDTRLVLGDARIISLTSSESLLRYRADGIHVDDRRIAERGASPYNHLITPYGKRSKIIFDDGTEAWVNAGSKLVYPAQFATDKREIYIDGEVYLDVARDQQRPFIVRTSKLSVHVLGTKFNVSAHERDDENTVALLSGSVRITSGGERNTVVLKPDQLYSHTEGGVSVRQVDASNYSLWTQGLYHFASEPLERILARLERHYGIPIHCDAGAAKLSCSGKLDLKDNLHTLLSDLTRALSVTYKLNSDGSYSIHQS